RTLGYEPDELTGSTVFVRAHPDDRDRILFLLSQARGRPGTAVTARFRIKHKNGTWRTIEATGSNRLDDPVIRGFVVNSRDITDRVEAEEQLQDREEEYRRIFEASTDGLLISDMDAHLVAVNPAMARMHGYTQDEILLLHPTEFIHRAYHPVFAEYMETLREGGTYQTRAMDVRKDGSSFPVEVNASTFLYRGRPHVLASVRDITERVESQRQLREKEAQYRAIFESSSDGLIINDPTQGVVVEANPAVCAMHGYTYDEFIGLHANDFIHPDYHHVFGEFLTTIVAGGSYQTQAVDTRKDGSAFHVEVHGSPVIYKGRIHILAVVRDVTARIQAEKAVTAERQRLSRELHDSVSQALYSIGLSVRTAQALLDVDPARAADPIEFALSQVDRGLAEMRALIFDLRPEALEREGLTAALQRQAAALRARHQIPVDLDLCDEPDAVLAVKEALYRIAQEALHNTVKHAHATAVGISLRADSTRVCLEIHDNGLGFDPAHAYPGHLGLRSMAERAEKLGGRVEITSDPGLGSTVRAWAPPQPQSRDY
ncbi:MAG TPA: PAS domain S-box protein, partial [Chloroflexota bacterium]